MVSLSYSSNAHYSLQIVIQQKALVLGLILDCLFLFTRIKKGRLSLPFLNTLPFQA